MSKQADEQLIQSTGYGRWFIAITVVLTALVLITAFRNDIVALLALTLAVVALILNFINARIPQLLNFFLTIVAIGAVILLVVTGFDVGYVFSLLWPTVLIFIGYAYLAGTLDIIRSKIFKDWRSGKTEQRKRATLAMRSLYVITGISVATLALLWYI